MSGVIRTIAVPLDGELVSRAPDSFGKARARLTVSLHSADSLPYLCMVKGKG